MWKLFFTSTNLIRFRWIKTSSVPVQSKNVYRIVYYLDDTSQRKYGIKLFFKDRLVSPIITYINDRKKVN